MLRRTRTLGTPPIFQDFHSANNTWDGGQVAEVTLFMREGGHGVCRREVVKFAVRGEAVSVQGGASAGMEEPLSSSADKHLVFAIC
jgi:hypothetical protein